MKRIICIVLIACLVPACSFAVDLTEFNANATMLGEEAIDKSTEEITETFIMYSCGGCQFGFKEENNQISRIVIQGDGISFLTYALSAILMCDDDVDAFDLNAGKLFTAYLVVRGGGQYYDRISSGQLFIIRDYED